MDANLNLTNLTKLELVFYVKDKNLRAVVGVSCCLSILGSLLIILSYILFKKRRTRAREILLHISLMDLGVALSNLIGLSVYFDHYYFEHKQNYSDVRASIKCLCHTQAFFSFYCTYASILWTIALAGFIYFLITHHKTRIAIHFHRFSYVVCYGLPLLVSLWLVLTKKLGYSPLDSSGWCSLITRDLETGEVDRFVTVFGYDLWVYLAVVTIPILYVSVRSYISNQIKEIDNYLTPEKFWSSLNHVDYKFLIIPVVFVFLRIWTAIMSILYLYADIRVTAISNQLTLALLYLSGIGDSSQGFANAIIFVIFTKSIRNSFVRCFSCGKGRNDDLKIENNEIYSDEGSNLNTVSSDREKIIHCKESLAGSAEVNEDEVSLVFGSLTSSMKSSRSLNYGGVS